ncbi:glycosyltransferase family protein [Enterococcus asini]|nr:hypothetical protein [Enterococcus asini]RGW09623.1 hypothetical protein DWV91_12400 [Enterococcus asini]
MNLEKRILKYSSLAFFATKETKNLYCNFFPNLADKFHVFMMGYAPSNLDIVHEPTDEKLTMIYGGMLNPIHRNPAPFLSAVSKFENVDVLIRSTLTNDWFIEFKETINKNQLANTRFEGLVDFTTFMKELMSKDILILFGNSSPTQIAGKVFNYISTGKHILYIKNFSEDVYDPVEEILKEYNNVTVTNNEVTEIAKSISVLIDLKNRGKLVTKVNKDMEKYTWEKQIEHFSAKLNETFHI